MSAAEASFTLDGKNALITGATGYLGSQMARCLASAGARVYINARSAERCNELVVALQQAGLQAEPAFFDILEVEAVEHFFSTLAAPLHVLVNNAYAGGAGSIAHASEEQYRQSYEVTVAAAHTMLVQALPALQRAVLESGDASVINIGSMYGLVTPDVELYQSPAVMNPPFYGAAKAALIHWSRYAAREFASSGIRVNTLSPGPFPSSETQLAQTDFVRGLAERVPLGRVGEPNDLDGPLLLLASSASKFMTGSNLVVDGGWTCV